MAHSLEVRPPFLDHRLVEFAASLPASFKIRGSKQKFILKDLMRGKLPPSVLKRKKTGFDIPTHDWFPRRATGVADGHAHTAGGGVHGDLRHSCD